MDTISAPESSSAPSLSAELTDLLIELASGVQRACVYGPRHPAVQEAAEAFVARNARRKRDPGILSFGAAGRFLVVELRPAAQLTRRLGGVATGLEHPLLGALAVRLVAHEVLAIDVAEGVSSTEIAAVVGFLASDPDQTGRRLGREPDEVLASLPRLRIHRGTPTEVGPPRDPAAARTADPEEDARVWSSLARTALAIPDTYEDRSYSAEEVATAITARAGNGAFIRRTLEEVRKVAARLGQAGPFESLELAGSFSEVLRRLDAGTLRVLLAASGESRFTHELLRNLADRLDADVILELLRTAAEDEGNDISRWMLRLLSRLARHAEVESGAVAERSDAALRAQIRALVSGWTLENPNPEDYEETLLQSMTGRREPGMGSLVGPIRSEVSAERMVAIALEIGVEGSPLWEAVEQMISARRISELASQLESVGQTELTDRVWRRLADRPVLQLLIQEEDPDWTVLDRILPRVGLSAAGPLLDRLMAADSLSLRRQLFDRLVAIGPAAAAPVVQCIGRADETPWYVLRNVLSLLLELDGADVDFDPWPFTGHAHPQVRLEAIKLCFHSGASRDAAILRALEDASSRIVALGILEAERGCPKGAEERLTRIVLSEEEEEFVEFRPHAIRALARTDSDSARETLLAVAAPRRKGLRRTLPEPTPSLRMAIRELGRRWPDDPRTRTVLELARSSSDMEIREAAS